MARLGQCGHVADAAEDVGILHDHAAGLAVDHLGQCGEIGLALKLRGGMNDRIAVEAAHRLRGRGVVRVQAGREDRLVPFRHPSGHRDRFPAGGGTVVHRRVRHRAAEQPRDLGLELEQHLQRALGYLRLVGRVGGEELAALDQVIDGSRDVVAICPGTEEERRLPGGKVLRRELGHVPLDRHFRRVHRQALDWPGESCRFGYVGEEVVDRLDADHIEHRRPVGIGQGEVAHSDPFKPLPLAGGERN